jgi:hypothetical protein
MDDLRSKLGIQNILEIKSEGGKIDKEYFLQLL